MLTKVLDLMLFPIFLFMKWLASGGILFTTVREGTVKAIMRGRSFDRFVMSFSGYHLNDPSKEWYKTSYESSGQGENGESTISIMLQQWEVLYHGRVGARENRCGFTREMQSDDYYDRRPWILKHLGLHWVGWPWRNSIYVYQFEWDEMIKGKDGREEPLPRAESTDFIYVSDFTYAIVTATAPTADGMPVKVVSLVTVAIRNPYRALFSGEDWMRRLTSAINRQQRNFVGSKGYNELIALGKARSPEAGKTSQLWSEEFSIPIIGLTDLLPDETPASPSPRGLHERYGIVVRTADLQTIELAGPEEVQEEHLRAITKAYTAEQDAKAITVKGRAEADVIEMKGDKEAKALTARLQTIQQFGESGIRLAGFDAVRDSAGKGNTIVWGNNPLSELTGALSAAAKKGERSS